MTAAGFDGSSVVAGLFWCSGVGVGGNLFHIKVSGISNDLFKSLRSQRQLVYTLLAAEVARVYGNSHFF